MDPRSTNGRRGRRAIGRERPARLERRRRWPEHPREATAQRSNSQSARSRSKERGREVSGACLVYDQVGNRLLSEWIVTDDMEGVRRASPARHATTFRPSSLPGAIGATSSRLATLVAPLPNGSELGVGISSRMGPAGEFDASHRARTTKRRHSPLGSGVVAPPLIPGWVRCSLQPARTEAEREGPNEASSESVGRP